MLDHLAARGHPAQQHEDQPAQSVDLFLVNLVGLGQRQADLGLEFVKRRARGGKVTARSLLVPIGIIVGIVLVLDLAHHLFDQILDGHKPVNAAIFVDHQRHMPPLCLHLLHQNADGHRRRNIEKRAQQGPDRQRPALAVEAVFECEILEVEHPERRIQRALIDRQARHAAFAKHLHQIVKGDIDRHGDDLGGGDGHILDRDIAQPVNAKDRRPRCSGGRVARIGLVMLTENADDPAKESARILVFGWYLRRRAPRRAR